MKNAWFAFLVFGLVTFNGAYSQYKIEGKVIDALSKEPLAFANLAFNNNDRLGTATDIDGKFVFSTVEPIISIRCTYVGYQHQSFTLQPGSKIITISLTPSEDLLDEVVVMPSENPAHRIMRKVISNKDINNPENIPTFQYKSYNKVVFDVRTEGDTKKDSVNRKIKEGLKGGHIFMMESVSERKFIAPDISEEVVIGTKVSGFQNPTFASLATDFQPFSFYKDNIKLFDIQYLNPVSKGSLNKYNFRLEDTIFQKQDTVYIIAFEPKKNKNIEGLTGVLYINTNKYAVQNVIATPFEKGKIDIRIQQQYALADNQYWFPEQLNFAFIIPEYQMIVEGKSYISEVATNIALRKKDFALEAVRLDATAAKKDSLFWEGFRIEKLSKTEQITYDVIDSIGRVAKFDKLLSVLEKLPQYKIPVGIFDIDLSKTIVYNKYEGYRLGLGLYTNEKLFENFSIGGFAGYGLRDYQWKYGGEMIYTLSKKNEITIGAKYQNNLIETGGYGLNYSGQNILNFRNFIAFQMDQIEQANVNVGFRALRYLQSKVSFEKTSTTSTYLYEFTSNGTTFTQYNTTAVRWDLRFAYKERIVHSMNQRISTGSKYPVFFLSYSRGLKGVFESDFEYNKVEARLEQSFFSKNLGTSKYRLEAGYIDTSLPYGLLFTGEGSNNSDYPYIMPNYFQTLKPYEFLSDRYANLFLSHNFGGLLFKAGKFQPSVSLHQNMGWGDLSQPENHQLINFTTKEKVFMESGLQLDNLVKFNYMDVGYFGIGGAVYYRYGAYQNPDFNDNIALRLTFTYSIK